MGSKYDKYWKGRLDSVKRLINEAFETGLSSSLDVSDLQNYGKRGSWHGIVEISKQGLRLGGMAHAKSLGRILLSYNVMKDCGDSQFRLAISGKLRLAVKLISREERFIAQAKPLPEDKRDLTTQTEINRICEEIHKTVEKLPVYDSRTPENRLPENGIYFFFENGERCRIDGIIYRRIVRVGTNSKQDNFRRRIRHHFRGNKNSSIFRMRLGGVLTRRKYLNDPRLEQWDTQNAPTFPEIEKEVSKVLKERFTFSCITVESNKDRRNLEERLIATLAKCSQITPSPNWLGHLSPKEKVRRSGLWNSQYVDSSRILTSQEISEFKQIVDRELAKSISPVSGGDRGRAAGPRVVCFIPCCKTKNPSGRIEEEGRGLTEKELPYAWNLLMEGRNGMDRIAAERSDVDIDLNSPKTSAIHLYKGTIYRQFDLNDVLGSIREGRLKLFIISAWYGLVDAFDPLHRYEAKMEDEIAEHWRVHRLDKIIADVLLALRPSSAIGFFSGKEYWSGGGAKYRYFFTEGVNEDLKRGFRMRMRGCFYNVSGLGAIAILGALGRTFMSYLKSGFSEDFICDVERRGIKDGNVEIGFHRLI
ncbi:MAG: hypothetical protein ACFFBS_08065 [Promethearchaeota archaeon]